jgi:hypothetical protein
MNIVRFKANLVKYDPCSLQNVYADPVVRISRLEEVLVFKK